VSELAGQDGGKIKGDSWSFKAQTRRSPMSEIESTEKKIRNIRRQNRKKYSAEEKIRIVIEGLRGDESIAELCRREGIAQSKYYKWSKEFMEAGKQRLAGNTKRQADSSEVKELRKENGQLKELVAEIALKNKVLTPVLADGAREKSLLG